MIPTIVQSVGVGSRLNGNEASRPLHQKTSSPIPAPTASSATSGFPIGLSFSLRFWTIRIFRPRRDSFLIVQTTFPITRASCINELLPAEAVEAAQMKASGARREILSAARPALAVEAVVMDRPGLKDRCASAEAEVERRT